MQTILGKSLINVFSNICVHSGSLQSIVTAYLNLTLTDTFQVKAVGHTAITLVQPHPVLHTSTFDSTS